jgi:bacteriocin biosynthesis cyclodehydratase domain-containing protein
MTEFAEISAVVEVVDDEVVLPRRPRVLAGVAVLRRQEGELQIGIEPSHATVVSGLPPAVERVVHRLTGTRTVTELMAEVEAPGERLVLRRLLHGLDERGLVEDADGRPGTSARLAADVTASTLNGLAGSRVTDLRGHAAIDVHGNGRVAIAVACLLAAAGVGRVHVTASGTVTPEDVGTGYLSADIGRQRRTAARDAVIRAEPTVDARPLDAVPSRPPTLAILADAVVPAPPLVEALVRDRVPHLPVRVHERTGIVGPLVVPGRSSCLHCADLRRTELDPCWPSVAAQLAGRSRQADLACAQALAALAVAQTLRFLAWRPPQHHPPVWNAAVELDPFESLAVTRDWPPHPACSCGAFVRDDKLDR